MASLPSPTQVSGKHNVVFEAYYRQMDPKGTGIIEAMDAAKFLKKSGLSDVVLSRIWDLSDPKGRGFLDKPGFFVALKLVSLAQTGTDINMRHILNESANPPKVGEIPKIMPQTIQSVSPSNADWTMKPVDKLKYEQLFDSLQPVNGMIAGNKVKGVLMDSKLPLETLGKIWDLADQDKDGNLDKHEFTVAMHLVYQALDKRAVPIVLPLELQKSKQCISVPVIDDGFAEGGFVANFPKDIAPPPVPPLPAVIAAPSQPQPTPINSADSIMPLNSAASSIPIGPGSYDWVVTPADKVRYEGMFRESDKDKDGLVSGLEVKNVFLQSGVPQNCLAHIWNENISKQPSEKVRDECNADRVSLLNNMLREHSSISRSSSSLSNGSSLGQLSYEKLKKCQKNEADRNHRESVEFDSDFNIIGKRFLIQLKSLSVTQRIIAEKLISDVMFYGQLGKLEATTTINLQGTKDKHSFLKYNQYNYKRNVNDNE